jgi:type IV pilus assembly protein PilX
MKTSVRLANCSLPSHHAQTGATLIVGLVLLLVLTVVGVSGMNTATMEITMAANTQYQQDAFQQAEDAIDLIIGPRNYITSQPREVVWLGAPDVDRHAVVTYAEVMTPILDKIFSTDIVAFHYDITAQGLGPRNATSAQSQGFYVIAQINN